MSEKRNKALETDDALMYDRDLRLVASGQLPASSGGFTPIHNFNDKNEPPKLVDWNAFMTNNGEHVVFKMTFRPLGTQAEDYEAHAYFTKRAFMVNTTFAPVEDDIALIQDGEKYRFIKFNSENRFPVVGVLIQSMWDLRRGVN
jgi:hypothetical protein